MKTKLYLHYLLILGSLTCFTNAQPIITSVVRGFDPVLGTFVQVNASPCIITSQNNELGTPSGNLRFFWWIESVFQGGEEWQGSKVFPNPGQYSGSTLTCYVYVGNTFTPNGYYSIATSTPYSATIGNQGPQIFMVQNTADPNGSSWIRCMQPYFNASVPDIRWQQWTGTGWTTVASGVFHFIANPAECKKFQALVENDQFSLTSTGTWECMAGGQPPGPSCTSATCPATASYSNCGWRWITQ